MANTTFIDLELLEAGDITLAQLIDKLNQNTEKIDNHDHTTGRGREIPLSSIIADSSLNMNENSVLNIDTIGMLNKTSPSTLNNSVYFKNGELFIRDGSGREIQISQEGGLIATAGTSRTPLWASVNVTTGPLATGTRLGNWVTAPDKPDSVTGIGSDLLVLPIHPPSNAILGYWVVSEIDGTEIDSYFFPWGGLYRSNTDRQLKIAVAGNKYGVITQGWLAGSQRFFVNPKSRGTSEDADTCLLYTSPSPRD